jgi:hypothetical protein
MILNTILLLGLYFSITGAVLPHPFIKRNSIWDLVNISKNRMIIKNKLIRLRLSPDFIRNERRRHVIKRINIRNLTKLFHSVCSSYYAYLCSYYSISEEDKYLIEFIISATY